MREDPTDTCPEAELPEVDCVIIGVNCEKTLARCISSILEGSYPARNLHLFYSDGGSTDASVSIARQFDGVTVIELHPENPTPGLGRNAGWRHGNSPYVQFLDSDTILAPGWLTAAVQIMKTPEVGAVRGYRREQHPEQSFFNWIGDMEWNAAPGECDSFGGDILIRRMALEESGGYDENLIAGEDPELSWRIGRRGWKILMLDELMTGHDLAMLKISQYLKRSFRTGYGFAAVQSRVAAAGCDFWKADLRRILIKGGGFILFSIAGLLLLLLAINRIAPVLLVAGAALCFLAGSLMIFSPRLFRIDRFMQKNNLNRAEAKKYAWHCSLVVLPQFLGIIRFFAGRYLNKPLTNKRAALKTGVSSHGAGKKIEGWHGSGHR